MRVIFSIFSVLIGYGLYFLFLQDNLLEAFSSLPDANRILDLWMMGGVLAPIAISTTLSAVSRFVYDRERQVMVDLLHYLEIFSEITPNVIPVKTEDRIVLLKVEDLILVDVDGTQLVLETMTETLRTTERLYKFKERLKNPDFVQVSKQSLININHLNYLETSFSGNMTARLDKNIRTIVSRRYLKDLEARLGL